MNELTAIVIQLKSGDASAFEQLIDQVQNRLLKFCFFLSGSKEVAEDLTQDTLIKVHAKIQSLKNPETFVGWMFQIARNQYLDHVRSKKESHVELTHEPQSDSSLEIIIGIRKVLSQFETEDRFLLLLVDLEELSYAEAATTLGISEDAVRSRIHRLREQFKKYYSSSETK